MHKKHCYRCRIFGISMKKIKFLVFFFFTSLAVEGQSIQNVLEGNYKNPPVYHFNLILARQSYIADYSKVIYDELRSRISDDPSFNRQAYQSLVFEKINMEDYAVKGAGKGRLFTFESQELYDQFKDFAETENQLRELRKFKEILLTGASQKFATSLFQNRFLMALEQYNSGSFRIANIALSDILEEYKSVYNQLDDVTFARAECLFALKAYNKAIDDYRTVIQKYSGTSSYTNLSIYKILFINYVYGKPEELLLEWEKLKNYVNTQDAVYYNIQMLLAVVQHQREDFRKAISLLEPIPSSYSGYLLANYIIGNSYVNLDDLENGIRAYQRIERVTLWPWDPAPLKKIKTSAFLQLGYLHYIKGVKMIREGLPDEVLEGADGKRIVITPKSYFATGKDYFDKVQKNHPEYSSAVLAETWIDLQNSDYNTALIKVQNYINSVTNQELMYQAVFLEGYIRQKKNPGSIKQSESAYNYVINGMIANQFLSDFFESRNQISRQLFTAEDYIDSRSLPAASLSAAQSLTESISSVAGKLGISGKIQFRKDNKLFDDNVIEDLKTDLAAIEKQKAAVRTKGLRELVLCADSTVLALKSITEKVAADPVGRDIILFAQHAPLLIRASDNGRMNSYSTFRDIAAKEYKQITSLYNQITSAVSQNADPGKKDVLIYMGIVADDIRVRYNSLEVSLFERDFYRQKTEIERWGDASAFGISSLLYQEYERRINENQDNLKIRSALKNAISEKKDQFEKYMADLSKIEAQKAFVNRIDSVNRDFRLKLTDYRSVYFDPITVRPIPKEELDKLNKKQEEQVQAPPAAPVPATKPETKKPAGKSKEKPKSSGKKG